MSDNETERNREFYSKQAEERELREREEEHSQAVDLSDMLDEYATRVVLGQTATHQVSSLTFKRTHYGISAKVVRTTTLHLRF